MGHQGHGVKANGTCSVHTGPPRPLLPHPCPSISEGPHGLHYTHSCPAARPVDSGNGDLGRLGLPVHRVRGAALPVACTTSAVVRFQMLALTLKVTAGPRTLKERRREELRTAPAPELFPAQHGTHVSEPPLTPRVTSARLQRPGHRDSPPYIPGTPPVSGASQTPTQQLTKHSDHPQQTTKNKQKRENCDGNRFEYSAPWEWQG